MQDDVKTFRPCANISSPTFYMKLNQLQELIDDVMHKFRSTDRRLQSLCLPKFYVAGFPKCGTTSLYKMLILHQQIVEPAKKEVQFWRYFLQEEVNANKKKILIQQYFKDIIDPGHISLGNKSLLTLDSSASTIFNLPVSQNYQDYEYCLVPFLHRNLNPQTKYIIIMRNPTEQTWSAYWHFCRRSWKEPEAKLIANGPRTFHSVVSNAVHDFEDCLAKNDSHFLCAMKSRNNNFLNLRIDPCDSARLGISFYYFHLGRWLSVFPRQQFLFLRTEEIAEDPMKALDKISHFLSIDPFPATPLVLAASHSHANLNIPKEEFEMMHKTRELLTNFFRPHNEMLARLLEDDHFKWNSAHSPA